MPSTYARNRVVTVWQHSQQSSFSVQIFFWMIQIYLDETNIFFFLLRHLFLVTQQHRRISWTCGTGNEQCKFRQNIKWFGLKNCSINKMTLKCLLHPLLSVVLTWFWNRLLIWADYFVEAGLKYLCESGLILWFEKRKWKTINSNFTLVTGSHILSLRLDVVKLIPLASQYFVTLLYFSD